ncbi:MAG: SMC-Scp complex subunit ScpB [Candidatus Moranbacteria bacterium]|nr:SMC-Scp complex subunit ScpB [Candidatus Moranbacteria bacterium]
MGAEKVENIASKIESLLFLHGEPLSIDRLATSLSASASEIEVGLEDLDVRYAAPESGLRLVRNGHGVELVTRPENAPEVEAMLVADREETLGKATMETLAVVAYRGPVTRASIDAVRGVNSSFALRNLLLRGLIERRSNPLDAREYEYSPSFRLFELLGVGSAAELPEFDALSRDPRLAAREESVAAEGSENEEASEAEDTEE